MKRLVLIIVRFIFELPGLLLKIKKYKKDKDAYPYEERFNFVRKILVKAAKRARVRVHITGRENLPKEGGYLLTPNHQGMFDIVMAFNAIDRPFKIVYKQELDSVKVLKDVLAFMEYYSIDRTNLRQSMGVIRSAAKDLKAGYPMLIFPEGTRSRNGNQLLEFKGGTYKAAMNAKVPIVPAAFINSYEVLDSNSIKMVDVYLHIFEPITFEEYNGKKTEEIAKEVHDQIQDYINNQTH